jgi:hypothetical protein
MDKSTVIDPMGDFDRARGLALIDMAGLEVQQSLPSNPLLNDKARMIGHAPVGSGSV